MPKGEYEEGDDALAAAYREFVEETGFTAPAPAAEAVALGELRQPSGKRVSVWAIEGDLDAQDATSNTFEMEWPRGSGRRQEFPEVDRVEWVTLEQARRKLVKGQVPFLDVLAAALSAAGRRAAEGSLSSSVPSACRARRAQPHSKKRRDRSFALGRGPASCRASSRWTRSQAVSCSASVNTSSWSVAMT